MQEQRPQASGFLGTTAGVTDGGRFIAVVRFESAAAAQANSQRPEQGRWWGETERRFEGEVTFTDSDDVETFLAGGSNDAGFVQVMKGAEVDRERVRAMDRAFEEHAATFRPDLIGALRAWTGPDRYVEVGYFTSEAEAREGEARSHPKPSGRRCASSSSSRRTSSSSTSRIPGSTEHQLPLASALWSTHEPRDDGVASGVAPSR